MGGAGCQSPGLPETRSLCLSAMCILHDDLKAKSASSSKESRRDRKHQEKPRTPTGTRDGGGGACLGGNHPGAVLSESPRPMATAPQELWVSSRDADIFRSSSGNVIRPQRTNMARCGWKEGSPGGGEGL